MKKILTTLLCVVATFTAQAQYQLANGDFESWETVEYTSTKVSDEPTRWSSFYDATGGMKNMGTGTTPQIYKDEDVRPESAGQYSCRITSRSVFGVVAQGNLTNGCVNMGSMTATDASGNYNYINEAREDQAMRFSGRPDAVRFWVKFSGVKNGNCSVMLTTKGYYQDPVYQDRNTATLVGQALSGTRIVSNDEWTQYTVPFEWLSKEQPYYALVNVSTCSEPGAGAAADYLYIDDVEMIYNSEATAVNYDGVNILGSEQLDEDFDPAKMGEVKTNGRGAKTSWKFESSTNKLTVTVEGDNVSEDPENVHVYQIAFTGGEDAESSEEEGDDEGDGDGDGEGDGDDDPATEGPQPVELVKNNIYYIFNKATGLFLEDNNKLGPEAVTEWIINEDNTIRTIDGKSVNITINTGNSATPTSVPVTTAGTNASTLTIAGDIDGYTFSVSKSWRYLLFFTGNYTAYLTGNGAELTQVNNSTSDASKWLLYDAGEYKMYYTRKALEEELTRAEQIGMDVTAVREAMEQSESATELQNLLDQLRLDEAQYVAGKYSEDRTLLLGTTDLTESPRWTTTLVANSGQHWSDDPDRLYYEQTGEQWGQSSWSASAEQTVELPAGQYLLKAAGRSSAFAHATMSVDGVEVAFPAREDYGYGIDIYGDVNFSSEGVYCNGGAGRGWEYRYLAFELKEAGTVTVKFEASADALNQWFSVCDIELLAAPAPQAFVEPLVITINEESVPGGDITVYLAKSGDEIYDFELPNFMLDMGGGVYAPIGTIRLTGIEMEERGDVQCFTKEQTIQILPGTDERFEPEQWLGPTLGDLPVVLDEGYVYDGHIYVHLSIDMMASLGQLIEVTVGDKTNIPGSVTGIGEVKSGNKAGGLKDGKYFIGNRVIVVKKGKRYDLSGRAL